MYTNFIDHQHQRNIITKHRYMLRDQTMKVLMFAPLAVLCISTFVLGAQGFSYDFFYFVQQWPGSYCDTSSSCCYPTYGKPPSDFDIHGLWPNYNNGSYPSNCDPNNPFDISKIQDLVSSLRPNWASLACPSSDSSSFWQHEWDKHGTCSETVLDEHSYFQAALTLKSTTSVLSCLTAASINPNGGSYSLTTIKNTIAACIGHTPWIECNKDASGHYQLYQVYICVSHSGTTLIDCPVFPTGACGSSIKFPTF